MAVSAMVRKLLSSHLGQMEDQWRHVLDPGLIAGGHRELREVDVLRRALSRGVDHLQVEPLHLLVGALR